MASTVRPIVSDGLGMIQYPVGTCESSDLGDHIMGVVALAWCTDDGIDRWGESWARHGSIDMRFRSHLIAGLDLTIATEHGPQSSDVTVSGSDGTTYATGVLRPGPTTPFESSGRPPSAPHPVPPVAELLDGYQLHPIEFDHVAERDLTLTKGLERADSWQRNGWAHPAWLASAANAIVRHNVAFEDGGYWVQAGVTVDLHRPIPDGAHLVAAGQVSELFQRSTHRFMVCDVSICADGAPAASVRSTSVYGAATV